MGKATQVLKNGLWFTASWVQVMSIGVVAIHTSGVEKKAYQAELEKKYIWQ